MQRDAQSPVGGAPQITDGCRPGNDLALIAEEIHPRTGELLGNFPQAFRHVGLVTAAYAISRLAQGTRVSGDEPAHGPMQESSSRGL